MKKQIILVIGGSSGYGKAIAESLINDNSIVITAQRSQNSNTESVYHDVTQADSWQRLEDFTESQCIENDAKLKAIIYSTGIAADITPIGVKDTDTAINVLDTNINGLYYALDMSSRLLKQGGIFINIGSIAYRKNYYGGAEYCASKAAQTTLIRAARIEGIKKSVRYCTLNPGLGYTNFQAARFGGDTEKASKVVEGLRVLDPIDVANAVKFMLSVPSHVCISELEITPTEQAEHGEDLRKFKTN